MHDTTQNTPAAAGGARFDWYAATVRDDWFAVERAIVAGLGLSSAAGIPVHGYESARDFVDDAGHVAARMLYGGNNGHPHVWASGDDTCSLVQLLRHEWPAQQLGPAGVRDHYVTRADSAIDYRDGAGAVAWAAIYDAAVELAKDKNLRLGTVGDWITPDAERIYGRTLYVGSPKSDVQVRLYEKGLQLREQLVDELERELVPRDWVRLEVRVRPQKESRHVAGAADATALWGFAKWTQQLLARVESIDVPRVSIATTRETDDERAVGHLVKQYGKTLARLAAAAGGWAALGLDLERRAGDLGINTDPA